MDNSREIPINDPAVLAILNHPNKTAKERGEALLGTEAMQELLNEAQRAEDSSLEAQVWEITVCEGVLAFSHGHFYRIREIFVPSLRLAINYQAFHIVEDDHGRYEKNQDDPDQYPVLIETIQLTPEQSRLVRVLAESKSAHGKILEELQVNMTIPESEE